MTPFLRILMLIALTGTMLLGNERALISLAETPFVDDQMNLNVELSLANRSLTPVNEVRLYYRDQGSFEFENEILRAQGFRYRGKVDLSSYSGEMVEYFFRVEYADGQFQAFPRNAPEEDLLSVVANQQQSYGQGEVVIISPEPNERIVAEELVVTVSFFGFAERIDRERVRLFLNAWDVSRYVTVYDEFLTFNPRRVPPGRHQLRLELYDTNGRQIARREWSFFAFKRKGPQEVSEDFQVRGNAFALNRYESISNGRYANRFTRGGLNLTMTSDWMAMGGRVYLSNREDSRFQPINRYTGFARLNFWGDRYLRLTGGDTYPQQNPMLLRNTFVRGFYGELHLGGINAEYVTGKTRRGVEGEIRSDTSGAVIDTTRGTFERQLHAYRGSIGGGKEFQFGISYVKGRDDPRSIQFGVAPEEAAAMGADIFIALDKNRLMLEGAYNFSFYNPNILDGESIPLDTLNELGVDISRQVYDIATDMITVNQYLIPFPARSYFGRARLRYLNNSFSAEYRYVQDEFRSFGQPFQQRDIEGLVISDNIRLFQNQVLFNLQYRAFKNNLANIKLATTENRTLGVNLSYFPLRNLPSFTIGYSNYTRLNDLDNSDLFGYPEDNATNTVTFTSSYPFTLGEVQNRMTLNLLNYNRIDRIDNGFDNLSNSVSINLQTRYRFPLRHTLEFSFQQSENENATGGQVVTGNNLLFNAFGGGLEYRFDRLLNQIDNLTMGVNTRFGRVTTTRISSGNESEDKFSRNLFGGRLMYDNGSLGRLSLLGDWIVYGGDNGYEDYILTARYDVSF